MITCVKGGTGRAWKYESIYVYDKLEHTHQLEQRHMWHTHNSQTKANVQNSQPYLRVGMTIAYPVYRLMHLSYYHS